MPFRKSILVFLSLTTSLLAQNVDYSRIRSGPGVSVVAYGADPSGVKDSKAAILACADANSRCFVPEGTYITKSVLTIQKHNFILECASRATTITYKGPSVASPFIWGGLLFQNHDTIENCSFGENNNVSVATIAITSVDAFQLTNVTISGGPIGMSVNGSVFFVADTLQIGAGVTTPTIGLKIRNMNQGTFKNPIIQQMTGATSVDLDTSGGTTFIGGSFEQVDYGLKLGAASTATSLINVDFEQCAQQAIVVAGVETSITGPNYIAGKIHVLSTAFSFSITNAGSPSVEIDAGAIGVSITNSIFAPDDVGQTNWLTDHGSTYLALQNNYLANGAPTDPNRFRLDDFVNGSWSQSDFRGQTIGCVNCVQDSGTSNHFIGAFSLHRVSSLPLSVYDGYKVQVYLANDTTAAASDFTFNNAVDSTNTAMGTKAVHYQTPFANIPIIYHSQLVTLQFSQAYNCWIIY